MLVRAHVTRRISSFNPFVRTGMINDDFGQGLAGLGMTVDEARNLLISGSGTADQLSQANQIYYAAYNAYVRGITPSQDPNGAISQTVVKQNADGTYSAISDSGSGAGASVVAVPAYPGNYANSPDLLAMEDCSPVDSACVARNSQRNSDNIILTNNANNLYNRQICQYNWALNYNAGNQSAPNNCGQYAQTNLPYDVNSLIVKDSQGVPITNTGTVADAVSKGINTVGKSLADVIATLTGQPLHAADSKQVQVNDDGTIQSVVSGADASSLIIWVGIAGLAVAVFINQK